MLKVGLTGNIGSGKTLVAGLFMDLGIPVFHADLEARKLLSSSQVKDEIRFLFGKQVFGAEGEVSRPLLAALVFNHPGEIEKLNRVIHPKVRQMYEAWLEGQTKVAYTLYEAAILFESGHYRKMDRIICVTAPEEIRLERVISRDHADADDIRKRMALQWPEEKKVEKADFVIVNDGTHDLDEQIRQIHFSLLNNNPF